MKKHFFQRRLCCFCLSFVNVTYLMFGNEMLLFKCIYYNFVYRKFCTTFKQTRFHIQPHLDDLYVCMYCMYDSSSFLKLWKNMRYGHQTFSICVDWKILQCNATSKDSPNIPK